MCVWVGGWVGGGGSRACVRMYMHERGEWGRKNVPSVYNIMHCSFLVVFLLVTVYLETGLHILDRR